MYILDTNVVSELMRPAPEPAIASWVADRAASSLYLTAIGEAELRFGLAVMPPGQHRAGLVASLERMLRTGFANRILPFDSAAARTCAEIATARRATGRPISQSDGQIAAIARDGGDDTECPGLRRHRNRPRRSVGPCVSGGPAEQGQDEDPSTEPTTATA